ncbi:MAG: phospholipase D-like domain-containing protein, partial [Verrucomicrobia bacterium]|nr:phospholipase D-like domain-containing protein [Verrucomicrobiota bacterium]
MTRFLSNDSLWAELNTRVKASKKVKAAVAFVGNGGADLLPLKKGDTLVVNLGLQTVKQGATSPKEIQRLIKRGVQVFTRSNLHAKFFICDDALLVGSANISNNSQKVLDEAASLTTDKAAVRRAEDFFSKLCTEPVRPDYLELCLKAYRPPVFNPVGKTDKSVRQKRVV